MIRNSLIAGKSNFVGETQPEAKVTEGGQNRRKPE